MRRKHIAIFIIACLCIGIGSFLVGRNANPEFKRTPENQETAKDYPLLAKRLFIENPSDNRINFSPLRSAVKQYFEDNNLNGSLYFEYLPTGTSIRVNEDSRFRGASLIKLPVAMELYKAQEIGKVNLDQKVRLKPEWLNSEYGTLYQKGAGYELSYRDAAKIMLTESDNTALRAVASVTESALQNYDRAFGALDIDYSPSRDDGVDIGTRSYSSFLKCLYFACYNNKKDSQELLTYLTETKFDSRIKAGIDDKSIPVAHKIGTYNAQVQSDCGIVYLENNNYALCIMLTGDNNPATDSHMAELSSMIYTYLKNPL